MKKALALFLCLFFPLSAFAGDNGYKIAYDADPSKTSKPAQI